MTDRRAEQDERLADWIDGQMSVVERGRFEAEMRVDPELAQAADEYRQMVEAMRSALREEEPDAGLADRICVAIDHERASHRRRWLPVIGSLAAAAALVLMFFVMDGSSMSEQAPSERTLALAPDDILGDAPPSEVPVAAASAEFGALADEERALFDAVDEGATESEAKLSRATDKREDGVSEGLVELDSADQVREQRVPAAPAAPAASTQKTRATTLGVELEPDAVVVVVEVSAELAQRYAAMATRRYEARPEAERQADRDQVGQAASTDSSGSSIQWASIDSLQPTDRWSQASVAMVKDSLATQFQNPSRLAPPQVLMSWATVRGSTSLGVDSVAFADNEFEVTSATGRQQNWFVAQSADRFFQARGDRAQTELLLRGLRKQVETLGGRILVQRTAPAPAGDEPVTGGVGDGRAEASGEGSMHTWIVIRPMMPEPEAKKPEPAAKEPEAEPSPTKEAEQPR